MRAAAVAIFVLLAATPVVSHADDLCADATVAGQKLRRAGHLVEARERFVACAQQSCVSEVAERCLQWLHEVDAAMPTVVVVAQASDGSDLTSAKLTIDGIQRADALGGRAIALDPGTHEFRVTAPTGTSDGSLVVREGEKDRRVVLRLPTAAAKPVETSRPIPTSAIIAAGVGSVALASFAFFGLRAVNDRDAYGCADGCPSDRYDRVATGFVVADISLGVAVVAFAAAGYLFLTRPSVTNQAVLLPATF